MPVDKRITMQIRSSTRTLKTERRPRRPPRVRVKPTTREIFRAFTKSRGYDRIVARIPKAATLAGWEKGTEIAFFSVCNKTGSARYLDLWDCDHYDGVSDFRTSLNDCRAWFAHRAYAFWGSADTNTGRINCYFNATAADHSCVVHLQSDPPSAQAVVECLIDNTSFGNLTFTGEITWPHFSALSAGGHHFRIRQVSGAFFFLSLTVFRF